MTEQHTLTITHAGPVTRTVPPGDYGYYRIDLGEWDWTLACPHPDGHGWIECCEDHDGYDPEILDSPDEDEEVIIHGAVHYWRLSFWAVDYDGCCILDFGATHDHASDILTEYGPGSYLVVDDWDDEGLASLDAVSLADGSPLPEPGWSEREVAR